MNRVLSPVAHVRRISTVLSTDLQLDRKQMTDVFDSVALIGSAGYDVRAAETGRQGLPLMGIQLLDEGTAEAPIGLEPAMLIPRPDVASVILRLRTWGVLHR
jgi:hypothetical protein